MNRRQRREAERASRLPKDVAAALAALGPCPGYDGVHTVEAAAVVAKTRVAWQEARREVVETYRRRSRLSDALVVQERHSPTVEISVDDDAGKRTTRANITRVRRSEAWRHNHLTAMQRQAEFEIARIWRYRAGAVAAKSANIGRAPSSRGTTGPVGDEGEFRYIELENAWREFVREAPRHSVHVGLVVRLLTDAVTLADVEFEMRIREGEAFRGYTAGLDLWATIRGWTRKKLRPQRVAAKPGRR